MVRGRAIGTVGNEHDMTGLAACSDRLLRPMTTTYHTVPGAVAIATRERPDYWLGNLLVLDEPPQPDDAAHWRARWSEAVAARSGATHPLVHFEVPWCNPESARHAIVQSRIHTEWDTVFRAPGVLGAQSCAFSGSVRQLTGEGDRAALHTLLALDEVDVTAPGNVSAWQAEFLRWRLDLYLARARAGQAALFGAWHGDALVGAAGVLWDDTLAVARYQAVVTHPSYRRQGICRTLLTCARNHLADRPWPVVLVAEYGSMQERLYASIGFEPVALRATWHLAEPA